MGNWKNIEQYKKLYRFIGFQSARLLFAGVLTGVLLFGVEVVFSYILQAFLVVMKVVPGSSYMNFPGWFPVSNPCISFFLYL